MSNDQQNQLGIFERLWSRPPAGNTQQKLEAYHTSPLLEDWHRIARDFAMCALNFKIYRRDDYEKNKERATPQNHPAGAVLRRPCKDPMINIDSFNFYKSYIIYKLLCGEWPAMIFNGPDGKPFELFVIPPLWILSLPSTSMPYYRVSSTTGTGKTRYINVDPQSIIMARNIQTWNPYDRGRGPVEILADEIDAEDYMIKYAASYFFNNATPEIIVSGDFRTPKDAENAKISWIEGSAGRSRAPKFINSNSLTVTPVTGTPSRREADFSESRKALIEQGRQFAAVPPELKGLLDKSNRATITGAELIYTKFTLTPHLLEFQLFLNEQFLTRWDDKHILVYDNIIPDDIEFKRDTGLQAWQANLISKDEARAACGYALVGGEEGNKYLKDTMPEPIIEPNPEPAKEELEKTIKSIIEIKAFSPAVKKAFWQEITTKATKDEKLFVSASKGIGTKQEQEFKELLLSKLKGKRTIEKQQAALDEALGEYFTKARNVTVREALKTPWIKAIYSGIKTAAQLINVKPDFKLFDESITKHLKAVGLDKAKNINGTTKEELRRVIDEAIQKGGASADIERAIKDTYSKLTGETMSASRAENIARTETIGSANFGALERYKKSGITQKEWLSEYDDKVRSYEDGDAFDHTPAGVSESVVDIDDPFEVSGELLMYPGDSSLGASAGNICQCRCTVLPVIK